jgi:hypothetical protein
VEGEMGKFTISNNNHPISQILVDGGRGKFTITEDDGSVREVTREEFEAHGYVLLAKLYKCDVPTTDAEKEVLNAKNTRSWEKRNKKNLKAIRKIQPPGCSRGSRLKWGVEDCVFASSLHDLLHHIKRDESSVGRKCVLLDLFGGPWRYSFKNYPELYTPQDGPDSGDFLGGYPRLLAVADSTFGGTDVSVRFIANDAIFIGGPLRELWDMKFPGCAFISPSIWNMLYDEAVHCFLKETEANWNGAHGLVVIDPNAFSKALWDAVVRIATAYSCCNLNFLLHINFRIWNMVLTQLKSVSDWFLVTEQLERLGRKYIYLRMMDVGFVMAYCTNEPSLWLEKYGFCSIDSVEGRALQKMIDNTKAVLYGGSNGQAS